MRSASEYSQIINSIKSRLGSARLMAVSKTRSVEEIDMVFKAGVKLFGENHVQEIVQKFSSYRPDGLELHMIGHLQSNKVSKVVPLVDMIESIDSLALLEKVDSCASRNGKVMDVLLEYNTSSEPAKSGFNGEDSLFGCIEKGLALKNIRICGLMTVGPLEHPEKTEEAFSYLAALFEKCRKKYFSDLPYFKEISMGMSHDWPLAVRQGSTLVRIGTAIFGERKYV